MSLLERIKSEEARRERAQREDLEALSHARGGATRRPGQATVSPFVRNALAGRLPASDRTSGR